MHCNGGTNFHGAINFRPRLISQYDWWGYIWNVSLPSTRLVSPGSYFREAGIKGVRIYIMTIRFFFRKIQKDVLWKVSHYDRFRQYSYQFFKTKGVTTEGGGRPQAIVSHIFPSIYHLSLPLYKLSNVPIDISHQNCMILVLPQAKKKKKKKEKMSKM